MVSKEFGDKAGRFRGEDSWIGKGNPSTQCYCELALVEVVSVKFGV